MKPLALGVALVAGFVLSASAAELSILEATGSGTVETNCLLSLSPGCTITATGDMTGNQILAGTFLLRIDTGRPVSFNGYPHGLEGNEQGICVPGSFCARLTDANGDTIDLAHVGTVCEEASPGSPYHYRGTYRVTGGTGRFAAAKGAGTVMGAFTRSEAIVYLRGTISY